MNYMPRKKGNICRVSTKKKSEIKSVCTKFGQKSYQCKRVKKDRCN